MSSSNCEPLSKPSPIGAPEKIPPYSLTEAGLSAFSVFFMQSPSFLEFQRTMQKTQGKNNAQTLFGVFEIPADNHIRSLLDAVEPEAVYPLFDFVFDGLQRSGVIDSFRMADHRLLLALDGTQYFSSAKLHDPCCSCKTHSNGKVSYAHTVVTPVLVKPGSDKVISLAPEFIRPQDGHENRIARSTPTCVGWKAGVASTRHWARRCSLMICTVTNLFAGPCWPRDLNSSWSANPTLIKRCTNGLMIWDVTVLLKP